MTHETKRSWLYLLHKAVIISRLQTSYKFLRLNFQYDLSQTFETQDKKSEDGYKFTDSVTNYEIKFTSDISEIIEFYNYNHTDISTFGAYLEPRLPIESESTYKTNDQLNKSYQLSSRLSSTSSTSNPKYKVSVVIPCYNETKRLGKMLDESIEYLEKYHHNDYEILIVDDGSSDGTSKYAIKLANQHNLEPHIMKVIQLAKNRGKGGAVTHGILHSQGKYSLFADADGATQFSDISKLLEFLESTNSNEAAIAIGSRAHMVNTDAVVKRSMIRNFLMYGLHTLVYIFGIRKIQDTQCGFKMFNTKAIKGIFPHMHTERWIFDVEVLLLGELQNMKMKEVAVNWQEIDGSKIDIARDSIEMAIDLVVTRLAYLFGIYKLDECGRIDKKNQ
ncbi:ALG5 [Candida jiufengensis]|uniref:ALG5 n=1 Tax=Candida jiufengensis TaxID=497108 RepID=UPI0022256110|nr:ALG5 [Candida jiufengensis]KAI5950741.1 ALG5 [Candida jiufengensis]